jgi:hypothetical protein
MEHKKSLKLQKICHLNSKLIYPKIYPQLRLNHLLIWALFSMSRKLENLKKGENLTEILKRKFGPKPITSSAWFN